MITSVQFERFTTFDKLSMKFSPGINVLVGGNGTGKTHIMKALYCALCVSDSKEVQSLESKLMAVFRPDAINRLVHRTVGASKGSFTVTRNLPNDKVERIIFCELTSKGNVSVSPAKYWQRDERCPATYIPVKDMLVNAPGFRSMYSSLKLDYEEIYYDIIDKALLPALRGVPSKLTQNLLDTLSKAIDGKVITKNEKFYLYSKGGKLEFALLAEGYRKLGLLYTLIQNGTLANGSILFWDEPEANLNPLLAKVVVSILKQLADTGVQVFIATHDYATLKEFDLQKKEGEDNVLYHVLHRNNPQKKVTVDSYKEFSEMKNNPIFETYDEQLNQSILKNLGL